VDAPQKGGKGPAAFAKHLEGELSGGSAPTGFVPVPAPAAPEAALEQGKHPALTGEQAEAVAEGLRPGDAPGLTVENDVAPVPAPGPGLQAAGLVHLTEGKTTGWLGETPVSGPNATSPAERPMPAGQRGLNRREMILSPADRADAGPVPASRDLVLAAGSESGVKMAEGSAGSGGAGMPLADTGQSPDFTSPALVPAAAALVGVGEVHGGGAGNSRTAPVAEHIIYVPVGEPGWDAALGERIVWLVNQQGKSATIHLDPPDLGPLMVSVSMEQNVVRVEFISQHPEVRHAIQNAVPQLRELLHQGGVQLADVGVHDSSGGTRGDAGGTPQYGADSSAITPDEDEKSSMTTIVRRQTTGFIDSYV
jgi:flagellar hook-length control protein FliK